MKKFPLGCFFTFIIVALLFSILFPALQKASEGGLGPMYRYIYTEDLQKEFDKNGKLPDVIKFDDNEILNYYPENWDKADKILVFYKVYLNFGHVKYVIGMGNGDYIVTDEDIAIKKILDNFDLTYKNTEEDENTSDTKNEKQHGGPIRLK